MPTYSPGQKKNLTIAVTLAVFFAIPATLAWASPSAEETDTTTAAPTNAATATTDPYAQVPTAAANAAGAVTAAGQAVSTLAGTENSEQLGSAVGDFWKLAWEKARPFLTQVWGGLRNIFAHFWNWLSSIAKEPPAPANTNADTNANINAATDTNINSDAPEAAAGE